MSKSNILPFVTGTIKFPEEVSTVHVNCNPPDEDGGTGGGGTNPLQSLDVEVLFPKETNNTIPLVGGSVVKLKMRSGTKVKSSDNNLIKRYNVSKLKSFASGIPALIEKSDEEGSDEAEETDDSVSRFANISNLAKTRVQINRCLNDMPTLASEWYPGKIPTLTLSKTMTSSFSDFNELNSKIAEKSKDAIRIKEMELIGYFKFIPIEALSKIASALLGDPNNEQVGLKGYTGISGASFASLPSYLTGSDGNFPNLDDDKLVDVLLELLPIIRVPGSNIVRPDEIMPVLGYYTAYDDALYIKTPDLSGRDSNGLAQNIYGLGPDTATNIMFAFEAVMESDQYNAKAFEYAAPPVIEADDNKAEFPIEESAEITIFKDGIDEEKYQSYKYYLSPILDSGVSTKVRGLETTGDGVELFTAPVLTAAYADTERLPVATYPEEKINDLIHSFAVKVQQGSAKLYNTVFNDTSDRAFNNHREVPKPPKNKPLEAFEFSDNLETGSAKHFYYFEEVGLPLTENLSEMGVESLADILGELNRPELLTGFRDDKGPEEVNETKYYDPKVYGSRTLLASVRPNIIIDTDSQIPAAWIPLKNEGLNEEQTAYKLSIPLTGGGDSAGARSSLDIYNKMGILKFALYVVDDFGQLIRAPGENIIITPRTPLLEEIKPNGYAGDKTPINLGTQLSPSGFFGGNALNGLNITVEGAREDLMSLNFYAEKEGITLLGSIRDGDTLGEHTLSISRALDDTFTFRTEAPFSTFVPNLIGDLHAAVQLDSGAVSNTMPLFIADGGTTADELPEEEKGKITFKNSFGVTAKGFAGSNLNSIPIIQDGVNNANILLETEKKTFKQGDGATELYAYLAILKNDNNKNILLSDVGWLKDETHKKEAIVEAKIKTAVSDSAEFYVPTSISWKYKTGDFQRKTSKRISLKFPGSGNSNINMSRFAQFSTGENKEEFPAYILLTNQEFKDGAVPGMLLSGGTSGNYDYAVVPIGSPGHQGGVTREEPAFASVPEVLGLVAELPATTGEARVISSIPQKSLISDDNKISEKIKGIDVKNLDSGEGQELTIIAGDELSRLAVIFKGNDLPNMRKAYEGFIGTKSLKDQCVSIEYAGQGKVVANFKNISGIKAQGWTDIVIKKKDKRFGCSYDSTLYSKVTTDVLPGEGGGILDEEGRLLQEAIDATNSSKNDSETDGLLISNYGGPSGQFTDNLGVENLSSLIFPAEDISMSPLPLLSASQNYKVKDTAPEDGDAYYRFSAPIKINPSIEVLFGKSVINEQTNNPQIYGLSLSDSLFNPETREAVDEKIKVDVNGKVSVAMTLEDMEDQIKKAKEEFEKKIENAKQELAKLDEATRALKEKELQRTQERYNAAAQEAETAVQEAKDKEQAQAEAEEIAAANQGASSAGSGGILDGAGEAVGDVMEGAAAVGDAAGEALGALNDALSMIQMITDQLSSIADIANQLAQGVEDAVSALGARPDDFVKVNLKYIYIEKSSVIGSSSISYKEDLSIYRITSKYKFSQNASIRFNVPEITAIRKGEPDAQAYRKYGDKPFSKLLIRGGESLYVEIVGANDDTKLEIGGKRVNKTLVSSESIFETYLVTVPDMSTFSIFGTADCLRITASNTNNDRMRLGRQMGNDLTLNLEDAWDSRMFGGGRNKQGPLKELGDHLKDMAWLKFIMVKLDKVAGGAKESLQSFCDFSFHLTAELSLQLRNFRVLLIPIKVIFCIIDVICALLNPWRLAFAIIRLFLCLYDLILLLPQLSVPAMFLALLLHILDLLLCVILKILNYINAINEVSTALAIAIEDKNYPAIVALEEALNEHIFSLETDLSVLEPIITILNLFLQLLQLAFAFPCRVGSDDDDDACIDPSQLAGIILGKVAPTGVIAPNILLPLAQAYTRLPVEEVSSSGNSPPGSRDNSNDMSGGGTIWSAINAESAFDLVARPQDEDGSIVVKEGTPGGIIPNHMNNATGELHVIEEGGFFRQDDDGDNRMDNIYYPSLRTNYVEEDKFIAGGDYYGASNGYFDATFALSFTKSTKEWSIFTGPDPRIVRYQFDSAGVSSDIAWWTYWLIFPIFFSKKTVNELQTLDSPPMFLGTNTDGNLIVDGSSRDFVSPIDGFSDFLTTSDGGSSYQPKPLTVTFELNEPGINPDTLDAEFNPVTVTKTFGNIPMIAVVDDDFNVYFVEPAGGGEGGIKMNGNSIDSINLKMINYPSAPKKKTGREKKQVKTDPSPAKFKSSLGYTVAVLANDAGTHGANRTGEAVINATANAIWLRGVSVESDKLLYNGRTANGYDKDGVFVGKGPDYQDQLEYKTDSREKKRRHGKALKCQWNNVDKTLLGETVEFYISRNPDDYDDTTGDGNTDNSDIPSWPGVSFHSGDEAQNPLKISIDIVDPATIVDGAGGWQIAWSEELDAGIPNPELGIAYDFGSGSSKEQSDIGRSVDSTKFYDFPQFYIVDMRQLADDIAAACGASGPAELLLDMPGFTNDFEDNVQEMLECWQKFMDTFSSAEEDDEGKPKGIIPRLRAEIAEGLVPSKIDHTVVLDAYNETVECVNDQIDKSCEFVVNPLNTTFKLLGDFDETPLDDYINPEQADPGALGSVLDRPEEGEDSASSEEYGLIDELDFSEELEGFPSITGAMEYASGIGDSIVAEFGTKVIIELIPRDSHDDPMPLALDLTKKITTTFVEDTTGSAKRVSPIANSDELVIKDGENYSLAVTADGPGKVVVRGSVCGVIIQAVTERGIVSGAQSSSEDLSVAETLEGCVDDAAAAGLSDQGDDETFAPGALMKVDRNLTILFVPPGSASLSSGDSGPGGHYGDGDREASARSAKPNPQTSGTKLEN